MWDFVMDKSGAGAGFLRELRFPLPIYIPSTSPQSSSLWPEAGTISQEWPQCQQPHNPELKKRICGSLPPHPHYFYLLILFFYFFYYLVCEAIGTAATPGLLCQTRVIVKMIVEKQIECRLAGETEVLEENLPQRHFCPSQNPTWPDPVLNPGGRGGKQGD
jgi:hypothetical protein